MPHMKTLTSIPLNEDWQYCFTESGASKSPDERKVVWIPLPRLSDWAVGTGAQHGVDWFRRTVNIEKEALNEDRAYTLCIEHVPQKASVFINNEFAFEAPRNHPFSGNITRYLKVGVNKIALKIKGSASTESGGVFGNISLLPSSR